MSSERRTTGRDAATFLATLIVSMALALTDGPAHAQAVPPFETLPEWPADGKLSPEQAEHTVFRDPQPVAISSVYSLLRTVTRRSAKAS
jgi:hypothetical protein